MSILEHLNEVIDGTTSHVILEPHRYAFKGSALPYCPVRDAMHQCQETNGTVPVRSTTFEDSVRMEIGSTIHQIYQKMLSLQGKLYGNWECYKCRKLFKLMVGPVYHCGRQCNYREIRIYDNKTGFKGAVDALICYKDGYVLVDFKTKADNRLEKEVDRNEKAQVFGYKYVLTRPPFNVNILGQAIIHISRENPAKFRVKEIPNDEFADDEFERYVRLRVLAKKSLINGGIDKLPGLCHQQNDEPWCPYNLLCFGPNRAVNLNREWENSAYAQTKDKG